MDQRENKIKLSKKDQREVSPFFGHEMLYDYLCGNLDKERRTAVEDHIKFSRDTQLELTHIQEGQKYADLLSQTVVSQPILEEISSPANYISVLLQKSHFDKWPLGLKWGLEALVVVSVIVTILTVTPWEKFLQIAMISNSKDVILSEIPRAETSQLIDEKPEFVDEGVKPKEAVAVVEDQKPSTPETAPAAPEVPSPTKVAAKNVELETTKENVSVVGSGGFLYRGSIAVTNLDAARMKITEKINLLGGRKAGSVELGWKKTPTSSYYHFTIPQAKYDDLIAFLSMYGKPVIAKEKHPRVMPDGILRLIVTVDEAQK